MSNTSALPQLFFSLDESLPEVISLESDLTFATPGPTSSQVPGPSPTPSPVPGPSPTPSPVPGPSPTPSPVPGPTPSPVPGPTQPPAPPAPGQDAGDTLSTAMDMGVVAGQLSFGGNVGGNDLADVYRFTLSQAGDLNVLLSGMSGDADLGVFDGSGNLLGVSETSGNVDEGLMGTNMAAGTYYAAIIPYQGASTDYNLTIASGAAPSPGPTQPPFPGPTQPPFPGASSNSVEIESLPIEFALA